MDPILVRTGQIIALAVFGRCINTVPATNFLGIVCKNIIVDFGRVFDKIPFSGRKIRKIGQLEEVGADSQ